jgi:hypothetical protein
MTMDAVTPTPITDPERPPIPGFEEPDYNEPVEDPDSGELPDIDPDEDDEEADDDNILDDKPVRA